MKLSLTPIRFLASLAIVLLGVLASPVHAVANYKIPGIAMKPGSSGTNAPMNNDKPYHRWAPTSRVVGSSDTGFFLSADTTNTIKFNTAEFNSFRNAMNVNANSGTTTSSQVIVNNPDSIVCKVGLLALGSTGGDSNTVSFGIMDSLGGAWSAYGATASTATFIAAQGVYVMRATIPFVGSTYYRPYVTVTTATDTVSVKFADCKDWYNH